MPINSGSVIEIRDKEGSTKCYQGTATTTPSNVPSTAENLISEAGINNTGNETLQISFDGGTTFFSLEKSSFLSWTVKGSITQLVVKTPSSSTTYDIILNLENYS